MKKELTVIIPFLNEGEEVELTIQSAIKSSSNPDLLEFIIINDCSNDNYNYESLVTNYKVRFVNNNERKGVAACRDMGVNLCNTEFFILLDAHMRFYEKGWEVKLIKYLRKYNNSLLCCQTKVLRKTREGIKELDTTSYGACINLTFTSNKLSFLEPEWNTLPSSDQIVEKIPCVLGAGYACSKQFWEYLKGLHGLLHYGSDEQYISLKVWLSGGTCLLLKDLSIGHIYRDDPPYKTLSSSIIFNRLLITKLLLPDYYYKECLCLYKKQYNEDFIDAYNEIINNSKELNSLKEYYSKIAKKDIHEIINWNNSYIKKWEGTFTTEILNDFESSLCTLISHFGETDQYILSKMEYVIILSLYNEFTSNNIIEKISEKFLDRIWESIDHYSPLTFSKGILGIGWAIEFLLQNKLMDGDANEILEEIDSKVQCLYINNCCDLSFETGIGGVLMYVVSRISNNKKSAYEIFNKQFLDDLKNKAYEIIRDKNLTYNYISLSASFEYIDLIEKNENSSSIMNIKILTDILNTTKYESKNNQLINKLITKMIKYVNTKGDI